MIEPKESIPYGRYGKFLRTKMLVRFFPTFCLNQIVKKPFKKINRFSRNSGFSNFPYIYIYIYIPHSYRRKTGATYEAERQECKAWQTERQI